MPSAALVVEVLSPQDATWQKFDFYAARSVDELWVVDPLERTVRCWRLHESDYEESPRSHLLALDLADVEHQLREHEE